MNLILNALVIVALYLAVKILRWYSYKARRIIQMTANIKAPSRHWFWGSLHQHPGVSEKTLGWYEGLAKQFDGLFKIWYGPFNPQVNICKPDLAKAILKTAEPKPLDIPGYGVVKPWLGTGLLLSNGEFWLRNRRLLTPAFHFDMLRTYFKTFITTSESLLKVFDSHAKTGKSFDVFSPMGLLTLDTILRCAFSYHSDVQTIGVNHNIVRLTHDALKLSIHRSLKPYLWPDFLFYMSPSGRKFKRVCQQFHGFTREIIQNRKSELKDNPGIMERKKDFLDMLLIAKDEDGLGLLDSEIEAEVNSFMFAGHDTTSSTLSWAFYALAMHPEHQAACREEVRQIIDGRDTKEITFEDIPKLSYVSMCIKETLRYYTTVPMINRQLTTDIKVGDHTLPKGVMVNILLYLIHRDSDVWEMPEKFNPSRFSQDNSANRDAFSFVPFSAGPRNCIGQNFAMNLMKVVLARVLNHYRVTYDASHPVVKIPEAVLRSESGVWLKFEKA